MLVVTIDGVLHKFRDGYWWDEETRDWIPWAGVFFGGNYRATRKELARRGKWLAAFAAENPRRSWEDVRREKAAAAARAADNED